MNVTFKGYECEVVFGRYFDGNNAIQLVNKNDGELVTVASVNGGLRLTDDAVGIKTWSENEDIVRSLVNGGVIEPELLGVEPTGFVEIEFYRLTTASLEKINELKEEWQ
ncbi:MULTISPECIES: hypothetical protein [Bacillus cereus group]|uniref:hypothetical protein n=1 Tax=Bacillus cereus group TaxID=86661 RepID=UPI0018CE8AA9|nr:MULTISPECIES: hypothetical protein [Bacillus cereus group]MBJ8356019.1 hypothetical protein [Bacillus mycoides]MED2903929.1 hypothetical protein [Bacillus tropicus]